MLLFALILALLLAGCSAKPVENPAAPEVAPIAAPEPAGAPADLDQNTISALIVDGAQSGKLVLADQNGASVYLLDASGAGITLDGKPADASALEDGMVVEIVCGDLNLMMPATITGDDVWIAAYSRGTQQNPGGTAYDLCGLYLKVLNDLWDKDAGLNDGAELISVDLSAAPGELSESEQYAVAWIFAQSHGVQPLTLGYDELIEQGFLTAVPETTGLYQWDNGVLFSITADASEHEGEAYSLPGVFFNAEKWRSPLGAYFFGHCTAFWPEMGTWSDYSIGAEAIA